MRELILNEIQMLSGGIWCTYDGKVCSGCANMIEIAGNDCSVITGQLHIQNGSFDTGGFIIGAAATWVGFLGGCTAGSVFGFSMLASGGIGLALSLAIGVAYATTHQT